MHIRCIAAFLFIVCLGCTTAQTVTTRTPLYKYRADIQITVGDKSINGLISVPRTDPTRIQIDSPVKMDLVRVSSCNRDYTREQVGLSGFGWWAESGRRYIFDFEPNEVEREGFCPVYVQIFDKDLLTAWGLISFRTTEKLKAEVSCNGFQYEAEGLDSCQSMYGFEQGLRFNSPIKYVPKGSNCDVRRISDRVLRVRTSAPGFCTVSVYDGKDDFTFVLLGYDEILVRGQPNPIKTDYR